MISKVISPTKKCSIAVFPPRCCDACSLGIGDEQIWSSETLENTTTCRRLSYKDCSVKVPFAHMVHIDSIEHGAGGWRTYLPYCASQGMTGIEWNDSETLTFA